MTNWGIMGTGRIAHTFAQAVNSVEDTCLYAVASRTDEKAAAFGKQYGAKLSYVTSR
jgi:predicted dehydrogenase